METFDIQESVDHKVLLIKYETLSEFPNDFLARILLFKKFNILSCCYLSFFDNSFLVLHKLSLMIVDKGIILSDLSDYIINLFICCESQECLFNVKILLLNFVWHVDVIVVFVSNEKEFFNKS